MKALARYFTLLGLLVLVGVLKSCYDDPEFPGLPEVDCMTPPPTTPYTLNIPDHFPPMTIPADNPMTEEAVALGRKLFYDPILSRDSTQSCGSCHTLGRGFTDDGLQFSIGITGAMGTRNSMALINLGWGTEMFWDGRAATLEDQVFGPVNDPVEMDFNWPAVEARLNAHPTYPTEMYNAFGINTVDSVHVAKAIAQFMRTLISGGSKFDQWVAAGADTNALAQFFTTEEKAGFELFQVTNFGCAHCHGTVLTTDNDFHSNDLFPVPYQDFGVGGITGDPFEFGVFKTPTLRNVAVSDPYMHDGSLNSLDDVLDRYAEGMQDTNNQDPVFENHFNAQVGGIVMSDDERDAVVAFLHTLTDSTFLNNEAEFGNPFD